MLFLAITSLLRALRIYSEGTSSNAPPIWAARRHLPRWRGGFAVDARPLVRPVANVAVAYLGGRRRRRAAAHRSSGRRRAAALRVFGLACEKSNVSARWPVFTPVRQNPVHGRPRSRSPGRSEPLFDFDTASRPRRCRRGRARPGAPRTRRAGHLCIERVRDRRRE